MKYTNDYLSELFNCKVWKSEITFSNGMSKGTRTIELTFWADSSLGDCGSLLLNKMDAIIEFQMAQPLENYLKKHGKCKRYRYSYVCMDGEETSMLFKYAAGVEE